MAKVMLPIDNSMRWQANLPIDYPSVWRPGEIREIPDDLWKKIKGNCPLTDDPATIAACPNQARFEMLTRQFRDEREAHRVKAVARYHEGQIQQEVNRQLALEEAAKIGKLRVQAKKKLGLGG
jgi:hypothetical protein